MQLQLRGSRDADDPLRIQLLSDIHLESWDDGVPAVVPRAPVLALLGDIGYASDGIEGERLSAFLCDQSNQFEHVLTTVCNL